MHNLKAWLVTSLWLGQIATSHWDLLFTGFLAWVQFPGLAFIQLLHFLALAQWQSVAGTACTLCNLQSFAWCAIVISACVDCLTSSLWRFPVESWKDDPFWSSYLSGCTTGGGGGHQGRCTSSPGAIQNAPQQTMVASPSSSPSSSNAQNVEWSKLLNKPPLFDYKPSGEEIRAYRDWNWQLIQFLNAIDSGYEKELQSLMDDPSHAFDLGAASAETRNRSAKLYGLLASLCRNRSLHIVRDVKNADGYEALRQLTLALRPWSSGRGLALMSALTSWPQFSMNQQLQPQLLKLEDALEEARKAGATIPDQLKQAILRKCVAGQLRTHLNLAIQETTTFAELRGHVLRWDRSQQRWNGFCFQMNQLLLQLHPWKLIAFTLLARKAEKTKVKGGNRKASKRAKENRSQSPKVMASATPRASRRETGKANQVGSQMIPLDTRTKEIVQMKCAIVVANQGTMHVTVGRPMFKLCSQRVNNYRILRLHRHCSHLQALLKLEPQVQALSSSQQLNSGLQEFMRLSFSRLQMFQVSRHGEVVFDLRSPASNASRHEGSVRVFKYYIGDEPSCYENGSVRAIVESIPEDTNMCNILLDSGADASIFPASMAEFGIQSDRPESPGCRTLRETTSQFRGWETWNCIWPTPMAVPLSSKRQLPLAVRYINPFFVLVICLRAAGSEWTGTNTHPWKWHSGSNWTPASFNARGWVRVLRERPQQPDPFSIRVVKADVVEDLSGMRVGWELNAQGVGRGKHFANCFQDPTVVCPSMAGSKYRTTRFRDGGQWFVMELCEPMETLIDLSSESHGFNASDRLQSSQMLNAHRRPWDFVCLVKVRNLWCLRFMHSIIFHLLVANQDVFSVCGIFRRSLNCRRR